MPNGIAAVSLILFAGLEELMIRSGVFTWHGAELIVVGAFTVHFLVFK